MLGGWGLGTPLTAGGFSGTGFPGREPGVNAPETPFHRDAFW